MKLKAMISFLNHDIDIIEKELEQTVRSDYALLSEAGLHLLQAGGKRIRPVFVLLSGMFGDYDINKIKYVAVALELIHMASLVHDDVIDDAELRRGKPTIKAKWDNRIAMYTGDYMFARSLEYMTKINHPMAHEILSKMVVELCLGEIEQVKDKYNMDQNLRTYLRRIKRKTALLIAGSCQLGAIAAGTDEKHIKPSIGLDTMSACPIKSLMMSLISHQLKKSWASLSEETFTRECHTPSLICTEKSDTRRSIEADQ